MKKLLKIGAFALAACMVFALAACSSDITGTYVVEKMTVKVGDADTYTFNISDLTEEKLEETKADFAEKLEDVFGADVAEEMAAGLVGSLSFMKEMEMTFTKDEIDAGDEKTKYKRDGNKIIPLDEDGEEMDQEGSTLKVDGKKIVMTQSETEGTGDDAVTTTVNITFKKK